MKNLLNNRRFNLQWVVENDPARVQWARDTFILDNTLPFFPSSERDRLLSDKEYVSNMVVKLCLFLDILI